MTILAAIAGAALMPAAAQADALTITSDPALYPGFDASIKDYVVRCVTGTPVQVTVSAPTGTDVSVDRQAPKTGTFTAQVALQAGQGFAIVANTGSATDTYYVRCLPPNFPNWTAQRNGTPQSAFYITTPPVGSGGSGYAVVFDANGVPLWWFNSDPQPIDAKLLPDGNIAWSQFPQADPDGYEEHSLDGTLVRQVHAVSDGFTDPHDLQQLSNGNYLLAALVRRDVDETPCGGPSSATINDVLLQEVRPDGSVVWSWDTADHIPISEVPAMWYDQCRIGDPYHYNAVESVGGNQVLISYRHLNAVYKVDTTTGEVVWKLGGVPTAKDLAIVGDPNNGFTGQHDIRWLGDGTVTIHDNETRTTNTPRAIRYGIDEVARTATLVEQVTNSEISSSFCCGSARKLSGGNWVMFWGGTQLVTEQTAAGATVFRLSGASAYRAQPITDGLSADALRSGMDAQHPRPYPRPKGATPMRVSLVPAYTECTSPNRDHGAPLAVGSCAPPAQTSPFLTVGTYSANGVAPKSVGSVQYRVHPGDTSTSANEADVNVDVSLTDVRRQSDLSDYTGELQANAPLRITDRLSGPSQKESATVHDTDLPVAVPCAATVDTTVGASCSVSSSFNAIVPGAILEGKRAIWQLGQVQVFDGGASGVAGASDARLFEVAGIFAP